MFNSVANIHKVSEMAVVFFEKCAKREYYRLVDVKNARSSTPSPNIHHPSPQTG